MKKISFLLEVTSTVALIYTIACGVSLLVVSNKAAALQIELMTCDYDCDRITESGIDVMAYHRDQNYKKQVDTVVQEKIMHADTVQNVFTYLPEAMLSPGETLTLEALRSLKSDT